MALLLVACIVAIVYSPFIDLPLTVHITVHSRAGRPAQTALVSLASDFSAPHLFSAFEMAEQSPSCSEIVTIKCSYRC
jgi:hypothetical protein